MRTNPKKFTVMMNTPEYITARKMSIYWLPLLLLNGTDVYQLHENKGRVARRLATAYPWLICAMWTSIMMSSSLFLIVERVDYIDTLTYVIGSFSTLVLFVIGLHKRPVINKMLTAMRDEFWYEHDDRSRRLTADQLFVRFVRTYGAVFPMANALMCTSPLVWSLQQEDIGSQKANIYRTWMPWEPTLARYAVLYVVQFVISIIVLANITGMVFSMVIFVGEMQVQMDMLVNGVRGLDVDDLYDSGRLDPDRSQRSSDGFVECIKHHQMLIDFFNHFKSYFNMLFIVELAYILIMTCLCAGSLLLAEGININILSLLTVVISQYFFYCLIGEQFAGMNKKLGDCVYFKLLKCKCPKLKRMGFLVVLRCQKPLQLTAMGISKYTASLFTFTVTMKSAYAGLNVLYNSLK